MMRVKQSLFRVVSEILPIGMKSCALEGMVMELGMPKVSEIPVRMSEHHAVKEPMERMY